MQYSKDGVIWTYERDKFDGPTIARCLNIQPGEYIYYREGPVSTGGKLKWSGK